jgi:hypothetical protein
MRHRILGEDFQIFDDDTEFLRTKRKREESKDA